MQKHFITIHDLSKKDMLDIFELAEKFRDNFNAAKTEPILRGKWITNLFFEPSTRTRCSFEIAAKNLQGEVLNIDTAVSSITKGEEIVDTFKNIEAMGCHIAVVRHAQDGVMREIANHLEKMSVINAGDGQNEHPTQAMLDMFTIRQYKPDFSQLSVAIVGDIAHSRVARSDILALQKLGAKNIRVIAPSFLLPKDIQDLNVEIFEELDEGLKDVDVIIALRIQKERISKDAEQTIDGLYAAYRITEKALSFAKRDVIVMHPGPLNRGIEITSAVADGPHSVILQQVTNGVFIRMAVFKYVLCSKGVS